MKNVSIKMILIVVAIIAAAALMFVFAIQGVQNNAISIEEQIQTAKSDISVQEKRRADLIPIWLIVSRRTMSTSITPLCSS